MATIAEEIAEMFDGDGSCFELPDGRALDAECEARMAANGKTVEFHKARYVFPDGSVIVVAGDGWDFGLDPGCMCWRSARFGRHAESCEIGDGVGSSWTPTHRVFVDGEATDVMRVDSDDDGGASLYTREEWEAQVSADWTIDDGGSVLFHGSVPVCRSYHLESRWVCTNDRYTCEPQDYDDIDEFCDMCAECFGDEFDPDGIRYNGTHWLDDHGEVVLVPAYEYYAER